MTRALAIDYSEAWHEVIQERMRGYLRSGEHWMTWTTLSTWRRVRYDGKVYAWIAFGDVVYAPGGRPPADAHMPVQPTEPFVQRLCDCGGAKAKTTHALWCRTQPQPFGRTQAFDASKVRVLIGGVECTFFSPDYACDEVTK